MGIFERNLILVAVGIVGFLGAASYYSIPNRIVKAENNGEISGSVALTELTTAAPNQSNICNGTSIDCMSECLDMATIQYVQRLGVSEEEARIRVRGDSSITSGKYELIQKVAYANLLGKAMTGENYSVADTDGVKLLLLQLSEGLDETIASDYKGCILDYERREAGE